MKKYLIIIVLFLECFILSSCHSLSTINQKTKIIQGQKTSLVKTASSVQKSTSSTLESDEGYIFDYESYYEGLNSRKTYLTNYLLDNYNDFSSAKHGFGISSLKIRLYESTGNKEYLDSAMEQAYACWDDFMARPDCFRVCYATAHLIMFYDYYDSEKLEIYSEFLKNTDVYDDMPSTTNHALQFAVGTYLANQLFPGEIKTKYIGEDGENVLNDPTAKKTLYSIISKYPITGVYECNSDTYFYCHFTPLLMIARCATDETLANMALTVIHNAIFTLAPIWLNGHTAVSKERCYQPYTACNEGGIATMLLWYYFGGRDEDNYPDKAQLDAQESYSLGFILADEFLPNWISIMMANDRSETYTHKECHYYTKDRYQTTYYEFLQSYINKTYGVYTMTSACSRQDIYINRFRGFDRVVFGVDWVSDDYDEKSNFSIMNWDSEVTDNHTPIGSTPYQDVLQYEGTVIGVYDIPTEYDSRYPDYVYPRYITINIPQNYLMIIDESYLGKMYIHYGNLLIGFKLSTSFKYENKEHTNTGDISKGYFVCEVRDANDVEGDTYEEQLLYFQSLCESSFRSIEYNFEGYTNCKYTSLDGIKLDLTCGGDGHVTESYINDNKVDYSILSWPSQNNPWVTSKVGDREVTYTYKDKSITFNFRDYTITGDLK